MKKIKEIFLFATLAASAMQAYSADYWFFNKDGLYTYSAPENWYTAWNGTPIGHAPDEGTDNPRICFDIGKLIIDKPIEISTTALFFTDKAATIEGETITVKNYVNSEGVAQSSCTLTNQVTYGTSISGKLTVNTDLVLKSASTTQNVTYFVSSGNANDVTVNGNISVVADSIDGAMTKFNDDLLKVSWVTTSSAIGLGTGNVYLNGAIDLSRSMGTWYNTGRLQITGRSTSTAPTENPYAVIGGNQSNNVSGIKLENSASVVLAKKDNALAGNIIESRGNNLVTFMYDQQAKNTESLRVMNARPNVLGDTVNGHTPLILRLNGTTQEFACARLELDQWGQNPLNATGLYQYLQVDFAKGYASDLGINTTPSVLIFGSGDQALQLNTNIAVTNTGTRLETDEAKIANRENAIKSGIILVNYDYENGDRIYFNSDKVLLADSKYYDDISKISTDVIDHIWLDEGVKDVDYKLSLELEDRYYAVVVTAIPEPATFAAIFGIGAISIALGARRKVNK